MPVNDVLRSVTEVRGEEVRERRVIYKANLHVLHSLAFVLHGYKTLRLYLREEHSVIMLRHKVFTISGPSGKNRKWFVLLRNEGSANRLEKGQVI